MLNNTKPAANAPASLYTNSGSSRVTITINAVNLDRTLQPEVTFWILPSGVTTVADQYQIESAVVLGPAGTAGNGPLRDDIVLLAGQSVYVQSNTGTVTFVAWGIV